MKSIRILLAAAVVTAFATVAARAGDEHAKSKEKAEVVCKCEKDKDGKVCGKDKACCCKEEDHGKSVKEEKPADKK